MRGLNLLMAKFREIFKAFFLAKFARRTDVGRSMDPHHIYQTRSTIWLNIKENTSNTAE